MDPSGFFLDFLVAAGLGGLIGVEREHRPDKQSVIAGVRTFPLVSITGFLAAFLSQETDSPLILMAGVFGAFAFAWMLTQMRQSIGQPGVTTPVAMVVTFFLGALIGYGYVLQAVTVGVVATFLLVTKERLHHFVHILDEPEILSALQFITILFIMLPLTANLSPDDTGTSIVGRGALIDPYVILLVVIFVSSISFVSLLAMRRLGPRRGLEFSGLLGGLVNSEATTASLAERAREGESLRAAAVVGIILSTTLMLVRNVAIVAFADPSLALAKSLAPYLLPVALLGLVLAYRHRSRQSEPNDAIRVKNPFAVGPALKFAVVFAIVALVADLAQQYFGEAGVYVTSLGGIVSAGAVVASFAGLASNGTITLAVAVRASLIAVAASVIVKLFIIRAVNPELLARAARPIMIIGAAMLVAVAASFVVPVALGAIL